MQGVEAEARSRRRRRDIQQAILAVVGVAGVLAVAALAPNVFQALPRLTGDKYRLGYRARAASGRLVQKGLVRFIVRKGVRCVEITDKGRRKLAIDQARYAGEIKRRWDKRYRLVMFDVPQYRRNTRDRLRSLMRGFGFFRLQNSVWVYPYDCEELIALVKAELRIGNDVLYVVSESIENDGWIKKHFGLS